MVRSPLSTSASARLRAVEAGAGDGDGDGDRGWPEPLQVLYRDHYRELVGVAYLIVRRIDIAEEVTQEAFLGAQRNFEHIDSLGAYLRVSVVNGSRSWHRRQAVEDRHRPAPEEPAVQEPDEMWDALARLNERRRTALVLRYYERLPDSEIAEILGCERSTVRTLIARALDDLRQEIKR